MNVLEDPKSIRLKIMDYLARREHSAKEIFRKLSKRVESLDILEEEINKLKLEGLLSDERFTEQYINNRKNKGFGPLRIRGELRERGIKDSVYEPFFQEVNWSDYATNALLKKSNKNIPTDRQKVIKLKSFLNYRGYDFSQIEEAFKNTKNES